MVGLNYGTHSRLAVIGGVLTITVADALSDALGMHLSEEAHKKRSSKNIWESTFSTFISKLAIASSFLFPVLLLSLPTAIIVSIVWGFSLLSYLSFRIARAKDVPAFPIITEHIIIAASVIMITYLIGIFVSSYFG